MLESNLDLNFPFKGTQTVRNGQERQRLLSEGPRVTSSTTVSGTSEVSISILGCRKHSYVRFVSSVGWGHL